MEGVWDWRHTEDGSFLKKTWFPFRLPGGWPWVYVDLGGGSSGPVSSGPVPGLRAPHCASPGGFLTEEQ